MKSNEWKTMTLDEIVDFNPRESIKKGELAKKIPMEKLVEFNREVAGYDLAPFKGGTKFRNGDTLQARITPCLENGKTAYVDVLEEDEVAFGSTEYNVWRAKEGLSDSKFLYYLSISPAIREASIKSMTGSTGRQRTQLDTIRNIQVTIPRLEVQKKIGELLSNFDDKISTNNKIISKLENTSQLLFKHWFIDFEFPNEHDQPYKSSGGKMVESELGIIPEGWKESSLEAISNEIVTGKTPPTKEKKYYDGDINFLTIPDMHKSLISITSERTLSNEALLKFSKKVLPYNAIAVSCIATPGLISLVRKPTITNQQINSLILEEKYVPYILFRLKTLSNHIKTLGSSGSTTMNLNKTQFGKIKIIHPVNEVLFSFNSIINPIIDEIEVLFRENEELIKIRDILLPKLLSGEIEVPVLEPEQV